MGGGRRQCLTQIATERIERAGRTCAAKCHPGSAPDQFPLRSPGRERLGARSAASSFAWCSRLSSSCCSWKCRASPAMNRSPITPTIPNAATSRMGARHALMSLCSQARAGGRAQLPRRSSKRSLLMALS